MKKRKVTRVNKEKIAMFVSSLLIISACTLTGIYASRQEKKDNDGQIVDFSELERNIDLQIEQDDLEEVSDYKETTGKNVVNPGLEDDKEKLTEEEEKEAEIEPEEEPEDDENESAEDDSSDDEQEATPNTYDGAAQETIAPTTPVISYSYSPSESLVWPVKGNVLLNYSMDKTILFTTLNQYKYNPAIIIEAQEGEEVAACANGKVKKVGYDEEIGNYIELDLGNSYTATIGQLTDVSVMENDVLEAGERVGKVAKPSIFFSLEGTNIYLKIEKDGSSVNPMELLD